MMPKVTQEKRSAKQILVIDDDATITKMVETRLKANGYDASSTNDAAVGLELALKHVPDLIILDVMMPIINGYNLCTLLRSEKKSKNIPIILLTSRSDDQDKEIGKSVGANAYMTKPFKMDELLVKISELLK